MSVLIKGMEMPTGNPEEPTAVWIYPDGSVKAFYNYGKRIINGRVVPVPPHGRLIDADALEYHADHVRDPMGRTEKTVMWSKIEAAPTIIPAEEGET